MALFFCQAEGKTQQASTSRTVHSFGNRGRFYMWGPQSRVYDKDQSSKGLAFFFLHYFKTVTADVRQPGNWVCLSLGYQPVTFF